MFIRLKILFVGLFVISACRDEARGPQGNTDQPGNLPAPAGPAPAVPIAADPAIPTPAPAPPARPRVPTWSLEFSPDLATLGVPADWSRLDPWQESLTRQTFEDLLNNVYASAPGVWAPWIEISATHAAIVKSARFPEDRYLLRFADSDDPKPPRYWRPPAELAAAADPARPLAGLKIAIDPGHMGGTWAKMEERYFQIAGDPPVQEGDLVLTVARLLKSRLVARGAEVMLVRAKPGPVATIRPEALTPYAVAMLQDMGLANPTPEQVAKTRDKVFCINAEIRARAALVNDVLRPDLVLALHFNGESWGKAEAPVLSTKNHLHVLVHGCLEPAELAHDDERLEMLLKLLQRTHEVERDLGVAAARELATATQLPPFTYRGSNARACGESPYLWIRNLLASRLYQCPVIYLEPHVMNHALTSERLRAGEYAGKRAIGGIERANIFEEYAAATAAAVEAWHQSARGKRP